MDQPLNEHKFVVGYFRMATDAEIEDYRTTLYVFDTVQVHNEEAEAIRESDRLRLAAQRRLGYIVRDASLTEANRRRAALVREREEMGKKGGSKKTRDRRSWK